MNNLHISDLIEAYRQLNIIISLFSQFLFSFLCFPQGEDGVPGPQGPPGRMGDDVRKLLPQSKHVITHLYVSL